MKVKFGLPRLPQALASLAVFVILVVGLASVDQRVRDKFTTVLSDNSMSSWAQGGAELVDVVVSAVRYQSIENAPFVLFATVGGMLFLFMVRT